MTREPEPWQTNASGPFTTIEGPRAVETWSLGEDRFRVCSPAGEQEVEGFEEAQRFARELAAAP